MYILDPKLDEDASGALMGKIEDLMSKQGVEVEKTEPWGKRRLAYSIKGNWEGTYILSYLKAEPTAISDMERRLRVTDGILRFLTVRMDEQQAKLDRRKARATEQGQARRQRRADKAQATPTEGERTAAAPKAAEAPTAPASPAEPPDTADTEKEN
jgi:small subunit ribosomal protein S6